jgi:serine/threonine protein kinase
LPPEAIVEDKYYFQSDLYQIGIILYQLLGGTFHINEPTQWLNKREIKEYDTIRNQDKKNAYLDNAIAERIKKGKLIDTKTLPDHLDDSFARVINKATHVDYRKRYRNSSEFLKAIHSLMNNHPCYTKHDDHLHIVHNNGKKEFKIYEGKKGQLILEKRLNNKDWRKENSHDGDLGSILKQARS